MEIMKMDFKAIIREHQETVEQLLQQSIPTIENIAKKCSDALKDGHMIFLCGNGGSAADCQHIAAELVGRFVTERRSLPAIALTTDTSNLTAIANDYGYEYVFARQVESLVREGDVVIGISTSGNSKNVGRAFEVAKGKGAILIGMTGEKDGEIERLSDVCLQVPSIVTARIQECHIMVGHMICAYIDEVIGLEP